MLIGTHTLLPVCLGLAAENLSLAKGKGHVFPEWALPVIGLFGALPDLCSPHISLEDRMTSWSHTVWFMAGLIPVCAMVCSFFPNGYRWRVAVALWLASLLHLFADAIAGGIAWLRPWRLDVIGDYYIPAAQWLWWDIGFVFLTWLLVRLRPHSEALGMEGS
ncbi:metal-dependent hydrolase [Luteolibacter luteus]|uniref:Metal-dependent hydrolase n=1 Tax=Luteolibacter luteus TaxID=2728835 RepID=A0A858RH84_9BACT|nr:metal-dependent hydrolase [Luteolibacter luteus]QJE95799.1 metal-dependent hydrolase [Luteolibacter luteus]